MDNWIAFVLFVYVVLQFVIAVIASRYIKSETDYLLAGRNLGVFTAGMSLFATWFGAETVMGTSGAVAEEGLSGGRADPFGYTVCLILMGLLFAYRMRAGRYMTICDFFRERFGPAAEKISALVMIPTSLIWAAAQILAFGSILSLITPFPLEVSLLLTVFIVIGYSSIGGMIGDVATDVVQGIIIAIGLAILLAVVISTAGGWGPALESIDPQRLHLFPANESPWAKIDSWMVPVIGSLVAQEAMSRMLSTKSPEKARAACLTGAGIYFVVGLMPLIIGLVGGGLIVHPDESDSFIPALAKDLLPPALYALFLGALISAILSTIDSALLSSTALAGHNIIVPLFPGITERKKTQIERILVVASGIFCCYTAIVGDNIFSLVEIASSFGSAGLVVCVFGGLYWKRGGLRTALVTLAAGVFFTLLFDYVLGFDAPYMAALAGCVIVYVAMAAWEGKVIPAPGQVVEA